MRAFIWFLFLVPLYTHALVLQEEVRQDLEVIGYPPPPLKPPTDEILDVAIIGGGQMGMGLCFALQKQGIFNITIFDSAVERLEGPWLTTARMLTLRSKKDLPGPAFNIPHLTFRAWYEAEYGDWERLGKIPTNVWAEYLYWYRHVLNLPVKNGWRLISVLPEGGLLKLVFNEGREVLTRKVVLATGRGGFGGFELPAFVQHLPKACWFHAGETIDPSHFQEKRVCVIGCGASAFDVSALALESGAKKVNMLMRRADLPKTHPFASFSYWPAFYYLSDMERVRFFEKAWELGTALPTESLTRLAKWDNFHLLPCTCIGKVSYENEILLQTNRGLYKADLLVLGTGYAVDVEAIPEFTTFAKQILLWKDRLEGISAKLGRFPYLGKYFEFLEKTPGAAPYLRHVHCFNYGAFLSHGLIAGDIDQISVGVERLAEGIATELYLETYR